ncbi:MAG TPA: glycosyl hydrolase family 28-related protein [Roseateles sp.]|nr:glycosyl hydrolase family 28-related protein [Roseateles sp.]
MAVPKQDPISSHVATGASGVFSYDFQIAAETDLTVTADGAELTLNVDYTVSGVGVDSGGTISITPTPEAGVLITVYRDTQLARDDDFQTGGDLPAPQLNLELDRLWRALQEIFSGGKGAPTALRVPQGETIAALPKASERALMTLVFDSLGNPVVAAPVSGSAVDVLVQLLSTSDAAKGDALIGVKQPFTGAAARTLHDKLAETISVMDFGAKVDGATDDTAAWQAAIDAVKVKGGTIWAPPGVSIIAGSLNASGSNSVRIRGAGNATAGAVYGSTLRFTSGAGSRLLDARSSYGFCVEGAYLDQTNAAFSGALIDLSHGVAATDSAYAVVRENTVAMASSSTVAVDVTKAIIITVEGNQFSGGSRAVSCASGVGNYANVINVSKNTFHSSANAPLLNGGPASANWNVINNTFEPMADLSAGALYTEAVTGLVFQGNYCGDANTNGTWLTMNSGVAGASIKGNLFARGAVGVRSQGATANQAVLLEANVFSNIGTADVSIDSAGGHNFYGEIVHNLHYLSATPIVGALAGGRFMTSAAGKISHSSSQQLSSGVANGVGAVENGVLWKVMNSGAANIPFAVQGYAGQAASLSEWRDSANTVVAKVRAAGGVFVQAPEANFYAGYFENTSATNPFGLAIKYTGVTGGAGQPFIVASDNGATRFQVLGNGNVQNANNSYGATSDLKLKQDIVDAGSQWADIKALRLRKYRFKRDPEGPLQLGLIAQEAELVSPGLVEETEDMAFEDGEVMPAGSTTKGVKYSVLYLKAVGALQEAMQRIEALEAKVNGQ